MENSLYMALSRQMVLFRKMDVVANNIANANSLGYKESDIVFSRYLADGGAAGKMTFPRDIATVTRMDQGPLRPTGGALDLAINGEGFFQVQTPLGNRYTRAGNFRLDGNGQIVTAEGYPLLGDGGQPITINPGDEDVTIGEDGNIRVSRREGAVVTQEERGQVGIVQFADTRVLNKEGSGYFSSETGGNAPEEGSYKIAQGMVEDSNVNPVQQLTELIEISRSVGGATKVVTDLQEMSRKAISIISQQQN